MNKAQCSGVDLGIDQSVYLYILDLYVHFDEVA